MRLPDSHTHRLIDCLTRSQLSFALYRLPWTDECYFVLQASEKVETLKDIAELNGKEGFVIAPFQQTEEHPLVLIRPDITAYDWNEIGQAISSSEYADAILTCKRQPTPQIVPLNEEERYERYESAFCRFIEPLQKKKFKKLVCPADKNTQREEMKQLLHNLERDNKGLRYRIFGAIARGELDGFREFGRMEGIKKYSDEE